MDLQLDLNLGLCYADMKFGTRYNYCGLFCFDNRYDRLIEKYPEEKEELLFIKENMTVWANQQVSWKASPEQEANVREGYMWAGEWEGHANPDHADVCHFGTDALREKIEKYRALNPGKDDFYDACSMTMDSLDILGERYREKALEMLATETDPDNIEKLQIIAKTFEHAPKAPCRDFAEAVIESGYTENNAQQLATDAVNSIRRRAGHTYELPSPVTLEQIHRERRVEFAMEGAIVLWDMIRLREYAGTYKGFKHKVLCPMLDLTVDPPQYFYVRDSHAKQINGMNWTGAELTNYYLEIPGTGTNGLTPNK